MELTRDEVLVTCNTCNGIGRGDFPPPPPPGTINFPGVLFNPDEVPCPDCGGRGTKLTPKGQQIGEILRDVLKHVG